MAKSFVLEGPEGAGKSTLSYFMEGVIRETTSFPVLKVFEPGSAKASIWIRETLLKGEEFKDMDPTTVMLLYTAARRETVAKIIEPFFAEHPDGISIGDRCWASTFVLQVVDGVDLNYVRDVQRPFMKYPDKIFYLDIPPEESRVRVLGAYNGGKSYDWRDDVPPEVYQKNRSRYHDLVREFRDRFVLMDGFEDLKEKLYTIRQSILTEVATDPELTERAIRERDSFGRDDLNDYLERLKQEGVVDLETLVARTEAARIELNAEPKSVLRNRMLKEWQEMGLVENSVRRERSS